MIDWEDTIVGPATAVGAGAVSILRMSGPRAAKIAEQLLETECPTVRGDRSSVALPATPHAPRPTPCPTLRWDRSSVIEATISLPAWGRSVRATLYTWPSGRSYTGQQTIEWHLPPCPPLLDALQDRLLRFGARAARPGEFTLRAFLAGKLDLAQAEGVLGLIEADNLPALRQAIDQRAGGLSRPVTEARNTLLDLLADLEAGLDFVEEDIQFVSPQALRERLDATLANLQALAETLGQRSLEGARPRIALAGPANAGKSSLFNALIGDRRALVSPVAGTTRDYLTAVVCFGDHEAELIDTAGLEAASVNGELAVQADAKRREILATAELIIQCHPVDSDAPPQAGHFEHTGSASVAPTDSHSNGGKKRALLLRTKTDLCPSFADPLAAGHVSVLSGSGLAALRRRLAEELEQFAQNDGRSSISQRCRESLTSALRALEDARRLAVSGAGDELTAVAIRDALAALGEIVGAVYTDDLLDRVFSRFCIGK